MPVHILMSHIVASFTENNFSLLRSKIFELHPVCRESLGALLRHLSRVASHSDKNGMDVEVLATRFCYPVLHGSEVLDGFINTKARCIDFFQRNFPADSPKETGYERSHPKRASPV
jgi:hypothetical protein